MTIKGIKRLSMKERHSLGTRLEQVMNINTENGTADYKPGHSDESIAKEFKMMEGTVAYNRRAIFGNYSTKTKTPKISKEGYDALMQRLADAMSRIESLETNVSALQNERSIVIPTEPLRKVG
jgi:hypothetical protein